MNGKRARRKEILTLHTHKSCNDVARGDYGWEDTVWNWNRGNVCIKATGDEGVGYDIKICGPGKGFQHGPQVPGEMVITSVRWMGVPEARTVEAMYGRTKR